MTVGTNLTRTKYIIDGKTACSQLTETQYRFFLKRLKHGVSMEKAFTLAKQHVEYKNKRVVVSHSTLNEDGIFSRYQKEISFFRKEIDRLQEIYKRRTGQKYIFALPIPMKASLAYEAVLMATRYGILLEKIQ